ncbi:MAG: hypothetical protein JKY54_01635 [Flavobacteriales bacterium]|nr:hypothetical protein [Flavobacteriales bacterium]
MKTSFKHILLLTIFIFISQLSFAEENAFEQISNGVLNTSIVSRIKGRISLIAQGLAWSLFIFTTGLGAIRKVFTAWKGGDEMNPVEFDEIMRKLSLITVITFFSLFSDIIVQFTSYIEKASSSLTDKNYTDTSGKYFSIIKDYAAFTHYYQTKAISNSSPGEVYGLNSSMIEIARQQQESLYKGEKKFPVGTFSNGYMEPLIVSLYNFNYMMPDLLNYLFTSLLLGFGKFISFVMGYAFKIYMGVLLSLSPLAFAMSIPKTLKNSYVKILNSLLTVAVAFLVLNVLDAFFMEGFDSMVNSIIEQSNIISSGGGSISTLIKRNEISFIVAPLYFIVMFGLFFSSMSIASKIVGASSDDGSIASKGFGAAISGLSLITGTMLMGNIAKGVSQNKGKKE